MVCLVGVKTKGSFIHKNRSSNCDTSWVLCHISILFQITKRYSYDDIYSIYIAISSSFLQGVYPVGVTDFRPFFTRIIGRNSTNFHRIPTNVATEICLNEPLKCAKFQPDWSTHSCFMADFANSGVARLLVMVGPRWGTPSHQVLPCNYKYTTYKSISLWTLAHLYRNLIKVHGYA